MSFKKVGINYISDKLLKCLLQDGSKYYVELKNGIRIPVAQADYEAIATDLVVVNGVAYADLSVIASCKQLVGGYIVEFANGNQLTTTELNFNALVAAGFCAIGDTYYNPSQIDKLYEADGAYFAVMANGQRVGMTEEEYEAIVGGEPGPEPSGLTEFTTETTQVITGIRFDTTALSPALENAITNTSLPNYESMPCLYIDDTNILSFTKIDDVVMFGDPERFVWVSGSSVALGVDAKGWYTIDSTDPESPVILPFSGDIYDITISGTVTYVGLENDNQYKAGIDATFAQLNGTVVGAIEGEPSGGLTPFDVNDDCSQIAFNGDLTVSDVTSAGQSVTFPEGSGWYPILTANIGEFVQLADLENGYYGIAVGTTLIFSTYAGEIDGQTLTLGYQASFSNEFFTWDNNTKIMTVNVPEGMSVSVTSADVDYNGVWFGKAQ